MRGDDRVAGRPFSSGVASPRAGAEAETGRHAAMKQEINGIRTHFD
jgi:hypothetical protein